MTTFLLCWYALGWAGTSIYASYFKRLTWAELIVFICFGGISFLIHGLFWLDAQGWKTPYVYNDSKGDKP